MKMRIRRADPAGNITIFVMDQAERKDYAAISRQLLVREDLGAEQVGFVEKNADGTTHMQMMGGEFCGNACRACGLEKTAAREPFWAVCSRHLSSSKDRVRISPCMKHEDLERPASPIRNGGAS